MPEKGPPVFLDYDQAAYAPNREQLIKRRIRDDRRGPLRQPIGGAR
jgi:hypothetical protein